MKRVAAEIPIGTSREGAYEVLRHHGLKAYNEAYATYKTSGPIWNETVDVGYWPQGNMLATTRSARAESRAERVHPHVDIEYRIPWFACAYVGVQSFYFDAHDRVSFVITPPMVLSDCM